MSLRLAKTNLPPSMEQRLVRMMQDTISLRATLSRAEIRGAYNEIEVMRDALSLLLDKADGK